ncbi:uncharacterized protein LOC124119423 [Haliotis rufescens]|uniref:uncharacterized protein LOC124119423 n=1 Tax=Haliotis rufescens TaxID=6454 RepID=UPI00201F9EFC|nr:uncharacterized protein LOC124119423 [Haliotis rufescens]
MVQQLGPNALLAKFDVKSASRMMPVHPQDFELLGLCFQGKYYFDKCLPFGCSISCSVFEKFSTFLQWCVQQKLPNGQLMHYLDDFLTDGTAGTKDCGDNLDTCLSTFQELGVPVAHAMTVGPASCLTFLGLEIDTVRMQVRIPQEKIVNINAIIHDMLASGNHKVTRKALQSLVGKLNFMCRAIPMGGPFCRRLIDAYTKVSHQAHGVRITWGVREDLEVWLGFLGEFNGVSVFQNQKWADNTCLQLFTDAASTVGFGAYYNGNWANGLWPREWVEDGSTRDMTLLELFRIVLSVCLWGTAFANRKVLFFCDNQVVVSIINKQSSKAPRIMSLIRQLVLQGLKHNILFKARYITTHDNIIADALSRFQWERFRNAAPSANLHPTPLPDNLWQG